MLAAVRAGGGRLLCPNRIHLPMYIWIKTSQLEAYHLRRQSIEVELKISSAGVNDNFFVITLHLVSNYWTV